MFLFSAYLPVQNMNLGLTLKAEAIHLTHNVLKSFLEKYYQLNLNQYFFGSSSWNSQRCGQTIHPTEKLISMNLFKILFA